VNVLGGDGGYNAIDPIDTSNFYASNPDIPPGGLGIQACSYGALCNNARFNHVVTSSDLDGDDGAFYFPYILDPGSATSMLVGTCRIWRGPRAGGVFSAVSPNFDTLGSAPWEYSITEDSNCWPVPPRERPPMPGRAPL